MYGFWFSLNKFQDGGNKKNKKTESGNARHTDIQVDRVKLKKFLLKTLCSLLIMQTLTGKFNYVNRISKRTFLIKLTLLTIEGSKSMDKQFLLSKNQNTYSIFFFKYYPLKFIFYHVAEEKTNSIILQGFNMDRRSD